MPTADNHPSVVNPTQPGAGKSVSYGTPRPPIHEFLIPNPVSSIGLAGKSKMREEQKSLFLDFITSFLELQDSEYAVIGLQSGYGFAEDQILLLAENGGSLCLPISILMELQPVAVTLAASKISKHEQMFEAQR